MRRGWVWLLAAVVVSQAAELTVWVEDDNGERIGARVTVQGLGKHHVGFSGEPLTDLPVGSGTVEVTSEGWQPGSAPFVLATEVSRRSLSIRLVPVGVQPGRIDCRVVQPDGRPAVGGVVAVRRAELEPRGGPIGWAAGVQAEVGADGTAHLDRLTPGLYRLARGNWHTGQEPLVAVGPGQRVYAELHVPQVMTRARLELPLLLRGPDDRPMVRHTVTLRLRALPYGEIVRWPETWPEASLWTRASGAQPRGFAWEPDSAGGTDGSLCGELMTDGARRLTVPVPAGLMELSVGLNPPVRLLLPPGQQPAPLHLTVADPSYRPIPAAKEPQPPSEAPTVDTPPATGRIIARLTVGGQPWRGYGRPKLLLQPPAPGHSGEVIEGASSGSDTNALSWDTSPGRYRCSVKAWGYPESLPVGVEVAPDKPVRLTVALDRATETVHGRVVDASGQPVGVVPVYALTTNLAATSAAQWARLADRSYTYAERLRDSSTWWIGRGIYCALTAADGTFAIAGLEPGRHDLLALHRLAGGAELLGADSSAPVTLALAPTATLQLALHGPGGSSLVGRWCQVTRWRDDVAASPLHSDRKRWVGADANGVVTVTGLPPGAGRYSLDMPGYVAWDSPPLVFAANHATRLTAELRPKPRVRGRLSSPGVLVARYDGDTGLFWTDAAGDFDLPSEWAQRMVAVAPGMADQALSLAPSPQAAQVELVPGATVRGVVLAMNHRPVAGAIVTADPEPLRKLPGPFREATRTNPGGAFALSGLPRGPVPLVVRTPEGGELKLTADTSRDTPVTITVPPPAMRWLSGVVRGADGRPLANATVTASRPVGPALRSTTRTGPDGRFVIEGWPIGPFVLSFRHAALSGEQSGTLAAGSRQGIELRPTHVDFRIELTGDPQTIDRGSLDVTSLLAAEPRAEAGRVLWCPAVLQCGIGLPLSDPRSWFGAGGVCGFFWPAVGGWRQPAWIAFGTGVQRATRWDRAPLGAARAVVSQSQISADGAGDDEPNVDVDGGGASVTPAGGTLRFRAEGGASTLVVEPDPHTQGYVGLLRARDRIRAARLPGERTLRASVNGLHGGDYFLLAEDAEGRLQATPVTLPDTGTTTVKLPPFGTVDVRGFVNGERPEHLYASADGGAGIGAAVVAPDGSFLLRGLAPGRCRLTLWTDSSERIVDREIEVAAQATTVALRW